MQRLQSKQTIEALSEYTAPWLNLQPNSYSIVEGVLGFPRNHDAGSKLLAFSRFSFSVSLLNITIYAVYTRNYTHTQVSSFIVIVYSSRTFMIEFGFGCLFFNI